MNLIVDIGNTRTKVWVVQGQEVLFSGSDGDLEAIAERFGLFAGAIMVSTRSQSEQMSSRLRSMARRVIVFDHTTPVPIVNMYDTPKSLGYDRLAAAVGAKVMFPERYMAIFDLGTAITIDLISPRGEYLGGNISPGGTTRLRALNALTDKLPLCSLTTSPKLTATNTISAIESGVVNSVIFELEGYIGRLEKKYDEIGVIFTGGEANFFAKQLKNTIFVTSEIIAVGLNEILEYNADKE